MTRCCVFFHGPAKPQANMPTEPRTTLAVPHNIFQNFDAEPMHESLANTESTNLRHFGPIRKETCLNHESDTPDHVQLVCCCGFGTLRMPYLLASRNAPQPQPQTVLHRGRHLLAGIYCEAPPPDKPSQVDVVCSKQDLARDLTSKTVQEPVKNCRHPPQHVDVPST